MANKIREIPQDMTDREKQVILWLGDGQAADAEGFTPWSWLHKSSEAEQWHIFQPFDQLRWRWGAVMMPEGTEQPRWCLTDLGEQYYGLLKDQRQKETEAGEAELPPKVTTQPPQEPERAGSTRKPAPAPRSGARR